MQRKLSADQGSAFYHDEFVHQQVVHFTRIAVPEIERDRIVVDMGGGCGFFASTLKNSMKIPTRVIDMDPVSIESAKLKGVEAIVGDAVHPIRNGDEGCACFNLILHHLVGSSEKETLNLQSCALISWRDDGIKIFINEYIYESWLLNFSGWLIYQITKSKLLSAVGKFVSKFAPSLKANTFGVGVRFRSNNEWKDIFANAGFSIANEIRGEKEFVSLPRKFLLIKEIRRDSFLLVSN
jgi:hypothetical protein